MAYSHFTDLRIFQLAENLADEIWKIVLKWNSFEKEVLGKQLTRSADSIGANIAEGNGRGTLIDKKRFIIIARGSLYETKFFLRRTVKRDLISEENIKTLKNIIDELSPKLNAYLNSLKNRIKSTPTPNNQLPTPNNQLPNNK